MSARKRKPAAKKPSTDSLDEQLAANAPQDITIEDGTNATHTSDVVDSFVEESAPSTEPEASSLRIELTAEEQEAWANLDPEATLDLRGPSDRSAPMRDESNDDDANEEREDGAVSEIGELREDTHEPTEPDAEEGADDSNEEGSSEDANAKDANAKDASAKDAGAEDASAEAEEDG